MRAVAGRTQEPFSGLSALFIGNFSCTNARWASVWRLSTLPFCASRDSREGTRQVARFLQTDGGCFTFKKGLQKNHIRAMQPQRHINR